MSDFHNKYALNDKYDSSDNCNNKYDKTCKTNIKEPCKPTQIILDSNDDSSDNSNSNVKKYATDTRKQNNPITKTPMPILSDSIDKYNQTYETDVREPDKPITETLIPLLSDFNNLNKNNYDENMYLKRALEESLQQADDDYFEFQLKQIENENMYLINSKKLQENIKNSEKLQENDPLENTFKLSLMEIKKEERNESLKNILYKFIKLRKIDVNFNKNLITLEDVIKKYINCEIDNYEIPSEIYKNIFDELRNIRVTDNELKLIKDILIVTY